MQPRQSPHLPRGQVELIQALGTHAKPMTVLSCQLMFELLNQQSLRFDFIGPKPLLPPAHRVPHGVHYRWWTLRSLSTTPLGRVHRTLTKNPTVGSFRPMAERLQPLPRSSDRLQGEQTSTCAVHLDDTYGRLSAKPPINCLRCGRFTDTPTRLDYGQLCVRRATRCAEFVVLWCDVNRRWRHRRGFFRLRACSKNRGNCTNGKNFQFHVCQSSIKLLILFKNSGLTPRCGHQPLPKLLQSAMAVSRLQFIG